LVSAQQNEKLWYQQPAKEWTEALPVGNGRLGAMIFGKVNEELIQLNEGTLCSGGPVPKSINPGAPKFLPQIRDVLLNGEDYEKAEPLVKKMQGLYTESYMPLCDLLIKQKFKDTSASSYYRDLNLKNAVSTTRFTLTTVYPAGILVCTDQVIVIRLSANKPGQLNFTVSTKFAALPAFGKGKIS
jgi:alpha-L-fucosidase 2